VNFALARRLGDEVDAKARCNTDQLAPTYLMLQRWSARRMPTVVVLLCNWSVNMDWDYWPEMHLGYWDWYQELAGISQPFSALWHFQVAQENELRKGRCKGYISDKNKTIKGITFLHLEQQDFECHLLLSKQFPAEEAMRNFASLVSMLENCFTWADQRGGAAECHDTITNYLCLSTI